MFTVVSNDGLHVAYVQRGEQTDRIWHDDRPISDFGRINGSRIWLSADGGSLLCIIRDAGKIHLVHDSVTTGPFDDLLGVLASPAGRGFGALVKRDSKVYAWVNDTLHGPYDSVYDRDLCCSRDGSHYAWVAVVGAENLLIRDGEVLFRSTLLTRPTISEDGSRTACKVHRTGARRVWCNGELSEEFADIDNVVFRPGTNDVAYLAVRDGWIGMVSGSSRIDLTGPGNAAGPLFSPDGSRFFWIRDTGDDLPALWENNSLVTDKTDTSLMGYSPTSRPWWVRFDVVGQPAGELFVNGQSWGHAAEHLMAPAFSADGARAGVARRQVGRSEVVVDNEVVLTGPAADNTFPLVFSPSGRSWLTQFLLTPGVADLVVDGRRVVDSTGQRFNMISRPVWLDDDRLVIFDNSRGTLDRVVITLTRP